MLVKKASAQKNMFKKLSVIFLLIAILFLHTYFALQRIKTFSGGDETLWSYDRVPNFWKAIENHNWKKTNISDKPGITLAMISGIGLFFAEDPAKYAGLMYEKKTTEQLNAIWDIYFHLRLPVLIFSLFAVIAYYWFVRKLLNEKIALVAAIFIGLSPILIGMSIYINSDSILWVFLPLTILSYLSYQKYSSRKYLVVTGILLGFSLLTKYVAAILFPFFLLSIFFVYVFDDRKKESEKYFKKAFVDYLILVGVAMLVIFLFYPATWVKPKFILETTVASKPFLRIYPIIASLFLGYFIDLYFFKNSFTQKVSKFVLNKKNLLIKMISGVALTMISFVIINVYSGMKIVNFFDILSDPRTGTSLDTIIQKMPLNILSAFYSLIFGLVPLVAMLFIYALIIIFRSTKKFSIAWEFFVSLYLLFFILIYYFSSAILSVSPIMRYQVSLYPLASIIAAFGLMNFIQVEQLKNCFFVKKVYYLFVGIILCASISLYLAQPYFLEYDNAFLPKKFMINLDNSGEGSWEVAQYLNNLPNADNLYVWTDIRQVCEKFRGKCAFGLKGWQNTDEHFDYFVIYPQEKENNRRWVDKDGKLKIGAKTFDFNSLYSPDMASVFSFQINKRELSIIRVIKNDNINN